MIDECETRSLQVLINFDHQIRLNEYNQLFFYGHLMWLAVSRGETMNSNFEKKCNIDVLHIKVKVII